MGFSASQCRLLGLTARNSDLKRQISFIGLQKMALTREMDKVSREYQDSLNTKVLKWSNNNGYNYQDLTYALLMTPTPSNANAPYMITDRDGRVVLNSKYAQYAEMVAPGGNPPGDWDSVRPNVLAALTGNSVEDLQLADGLYKTYLDYKKQVEEHLRNQPATDESGYDTWENTYAELTKKRDDALAQYNQIFSSEVESQLQFYDTLFSTIADKGWVCNDNVNDTRYLNEMFLNNMFTITQAKLNVVEKPGGIYEYDNIYTTDLVINNPKVFTVNDEDAENEALVKYENDKSKINAKETYLDEWSEKLQTEQRAITTMIESIQATMDKNVENTFTLFS